MIYTPSELRRIKAHPGFKDFIDALAYRFKPDSGRWPSLLPGRPVANIYDAAVIKWARPDWQVPAIVEASIEKVAAEWRDPKKYAPKDLPKDTIPMLAEAYWLSFKGNAKLEQILTGWTGAKPLGYSPGPTLHAVVLTAIALDMPSTAENNALYGYPGMPGILDWFSERWMHVSGPPKWETPYYNLAVSYAPLCWLARRYLTGIKLEAVTQWLRWKAFEQLPANLLMADGMHPRLGDDLMHDDNPPVKAPDLYLSKHLWTYSGNDAASKWLRYKAGKKYGVNRLGDLLVKVNTAEPKLPSAALQSLTLYGDDGGALFSKGPWGCRWHKAPWKTAEAWGGGHTIGLLPAEFIVNGGREFYTTPSRE